MQSYMAQSHTQLLRCAGKLQTVHAVQAARHQRCTLQNSQHTLENHCGRRFTVCPQVQHHLCA